MVNKWTVIVVATILSMSFVLKSYAESPVTVEDRAKLGEVYSLERLKKFTQAIPMIEDLHQHYADNNEISWTYVRVLGFGGHWKEAMQVFDEICRVKCDKEMLVTYAHILEAQGPNPETLIYIKKLADQNPDQEKIQSIYAEILTWNTQNLQGQNNIETLNVKYPNDLKIMQAYADVLVEQKKYADAITQMNKLLSSNPNNKNLRYQHAKIVSATGDHQQAVKELQGLLNEGFKNKEATIMLGDELRLIGRNEEALKIYQEVINGK